MKINTVKDIRRLVLMCIDSGLDNARDKSHELFNGKEWDNKIAYKDALHYLSILIIDLDEYEEHCESMEVEIIPHASFVAEATRLFEWLAFENIDWDTSDIGLLNGEWSMIS